MYVEKQEVSEQPKAKHTYLAALPIIFRTVDREAWRVFANGLPDTYRLIEEEPGPDFIGGTFAYRAASANANDLKRRLGTSGMEYVTGRSRRTRLCKCVSESASCIERSAS